MSEEAFTAVIKVLNIVIVVGGTAAALWAIWTIGVSVHTLRRWKKERDSCDPK